MAQLAASTFTSMSVSLVFPASQTVPTADPEAAGTTPAKLLIRRCLPRSGPPCLLFPWGIVPTLPGQVGAESRFLNGLRRLATDSLVSASDAFARILAARAAVDRD